MKALVIHGAYDLRCDTVDDPAIQDDRDAIIRVTHCGICGSDLHFFHGLATGKASFPVGHEAIGEVVEKGRGVSNLKIGDVVMLAGSTGCGQCLPCLTGHIKRCERKLMQVYGIGGGLDGCQAEAVRVPAADFNAAPVPDGISADQAILLTDNLPTAYEACVNAGIGTGRTAAIIGLGPIGLMAVELAIVMGATRVFAIDLLPDRRACAADLGATALDPAEAPQVLAELTKGRMVDCVVEAVGGDATMELALSIVAISGTVAVLGVNSSMNFKIPFERFVNGVTIAANFLTEVAKHWPALIPMVQAGRIRPERFVTGHARLVDGVEAYRRFDQRGSGTLKTILMPD